LSPCSNALYQYYPNGSKIEAIEKKAAAYEKQEKQREAKAAEQEIAATQKAEEQKAFDKSDLGQLKKADADVAKIQAEIEQKEKELALLDADLIAMKSKFGTASAMQDVTLAAMAALVDKKEGAARNISDLKKQRVTVEESRSVISLRIKRAENTQRKAEIEKDITNYEKIAGAPSSKSNCIDELPAHRTTHSTLFHISSLLHHLRPVFFPACSDVVEVLCRFYAMLCLLKAGHPLIEHLQNLSLPHIKIRGWLHSKTP